MKLQQIVKNIFTINVEMIIKCQITTGNGILFFG